MSRRITRAILGMVLASLTLAAIGTFLFARGTSRDRELARLESQAEAIIDLAPRGGLARSGGSPSTTTPTTPAAQRRVDLRERIAEIVQLSGVTELTIRANGRLVGELPAAVAGADFDLAALARGATISGNRLTTLWAATGRPEPNGATTVVVLTARQEALFGPTLRWFIVFAGAALAAGSLVSVLLGRRLASPVHAAVETTRRIAAGDLSARLDLQHTTDDDELAVLARSINAMAAELERSHGLERQFLMSVSHDLRTPLTSIRGYAEAIADGIGDPRQAAAVIDTESRRLERLVGDLLDLAKLDAKRFEFIAALVSVTDVVDAAARRVQPDAAAHRIALRVSSAPDVMVTVDPDRLAQAIGNLSSNALRFARSTVWIRSRVDGRYVAIDVADDGRGIPQDDLPHVFERLYQAANQPERRESGSGLGLAIVRELIEGMGGTVGVASQPETGTTFTIRFPIADGPTASTVTR